jgi:hypothetical protein
MIVNQRTIQLHLIGKNMEAQKTYDILNPVSLVSDDEFCYLSVIRS